MKTFTTWALRIGGGLVGAVVAALAVVYGVSEYRLRQTFTVKPETLSFAPGVDALQEGHRLAVTRGCTDCHGPKLQGTVVADDPAIGRLVAPNLTRGAGGVGGERDDADLIRAIRHGVGSGGRGLLLMPSHEFNPIGDVELAKMVAYIKSVPAVDNTLPENRVGPLARVLFLAGELHLLPAELIDHEAPRPTTPEVAATVEYGKYLASGCIGCHGDGLSGGKIPGGPPTWPAARNITPDAETGIGKWTEADFERALRRGRRPDGSAIDPFMPWKNYARMTDIEVSALYAYLRTVPARPLGNR